MFEPEKRFASGMQCTPPVNTTLLILFLISILPGDLVSTVQAAAQSAADQNVIVPAYEVEVKGDKGNIDKPSGQVG